MKDGREVMLIFGTVLSLDGNNSLLFLLGEDTHSTSVIDSPYIYIVSGCKIIWVYID